MNESEQAQILSEIKDRHKNRRWIGVVADGGSIGWVIACRDISILKQIVDSQAQRIAEQNQLLENCAISFKESLEQIAEQAKEIAKLKRQISGTFEPEDFHNQILQDSDPLGQEFR